MSFVSTIIISMLEKELASQAPEIEAYAVQFVGQIAKDLLNYVEKKIRMAPSVVQRSVQTPISVE